MITTIHQPDFMPWIGYFDKIKSSELLIYLDDVQFSRRGWTHRDKIKVLDKFVWLTVPIEKKNNYHQSIKELKIKDNLALYKIHLDIIKNAYRKSKNFDQVFPSLEKIYKKNFNFLIDLNIEIIDLFCDFLEIKKKTFFSSQYNISTKSTERLIDLLEINNSKKYLTGEPSKSYIDTDIFKNKGIEIIWHNLDEKEYIKKYERFDRNLSTLDFLMNKI